MPVLVTGATGFAGGRLVPALLDAGHDVTALVRDAADAAGVDRVVYLGGLGETGEELSGHLQSRREVEAILADGEADLTVLRAAIIIGRGSASFEMVRQLAVRLPVMVTPRWVRTECQPIGIDDVIAYLVGLLDVPETAGGTYEAVLRRTARIAAGREPIIVPVPGLSPTLSMYWVDLVSVELTPFDEAVARALGADG